MLPGNYTLKMYRGDTFHAQFKLWLDTDRSQPVDLTDAVAKAEIRDKTGGTILVTFDSAITLPNIIDLTLDAATSETLVPGTQKWDLQVTYLDGTVNTYVAGDATIVGDITDSSAVAVMAAARVAVVEPVSTKVLSRI